MCAQLSASSAWCFPQHGKSAQPPCTCHRGAAASSWTSHAGQRGHSSFPGGRSYRPSWFSGTGTGSQKGVSSAWLEGCAPRGVSGQCSLPSTQRGQTPMARAVWYDASGRKRLKTAAVPLSRSRVCSLLLCVADPLQIART